MYMLSQIFIQRTPVLNVPKLAPWLSKFFVYPEQWWEFWINVLSGRASTLFPLLPAWRICKVRSRDLSFLIDVELRCLYDSLLLGAIVLIGMKYEL